MCLNVENVALFKGSNLFTKEIFKGAKYCLNIDIVKIPKYIDFYLLSISHTLSVESLGNLVETTQQDMKKDFKPAPP